LSYVVHGIKLPVFLRNLPEGMRPFGRPRHRWEDNLKVGINEIYLHFIFIN